MFLLFKLVQNNRIIRNTVSLFDGYSRKVFLESVQLNVKMNLLKRGFIVKTHKSLLILNEHHKQVKIFSIWINFQLE